MEHKKITKITAHFDHMNIDVSNLERSIEFYDKALGLKEVGHRIEAPDGSFIIVYLGEEEKKQAGKTNNTYSGFRLELTWLRTHANKPYELGENETHLCVRVPGDYDKTREYHRAMGCICYENESMGLYFIHDPDDYWIEVLPLK
jgi:lactoylglutathione lyase